MFGSKNPELFDIESETDELYSKIQKLEEYISKLCSIIQDDISFLNEKINKIEHFIYNKYNTEL